MSNDSAHASILVVDDTPENLRLLTTILGQSGYEVRPVTSGRLALQAARLDAPDLILLDITMPAMDGYEVCRALKEQEQLKDIPVIFLTASSEISDKVRAFEVGGVDYITKPFQLEEVQARVKTHLALRSANLELAESYRRLQSLEKLRDDLVHMVVHDMRSPLAVLLAHLQLLQNDDALSRQGADDLRAAIHGAQTVCSMANQLLDVSRLESGKLPLQIAERDLTELAKSAKAALGTLERGRTISVEATHAVPVFCDGSLITRVLENLVGNAIKHTPSGSDVRISIATADDHVRVTVSDQGPGVPAEARHRIFEKFGTLSGSKNSGYHSAGLGLAFCKLAIEAHGGAIGVGPGEPQGSNFWFELPSKGQARPTDAAGPP